MKSKLFTIALLLWCFLPLITLAAPPPPPGGGLEEAPPAFQALIGIPGISDTLINSQEFQFGDYINALYRLSISIAALLAVIKIIAAGVKYMFDDIVTHKQQAKDDIQGALIGLLVILGAFIILNTINTDITKNAVLVDPLELNGSDPGLIEQVRNNLIGTLNTAQERCDAQFKTICTLSPGASEAWCDLRQGYFIDGSLFNYGTGLNGGTLRNYCYYDERIVPGQDTVALPPGNENLDPTKEGDLAQLMSECTSNYGPAWTYNSTLRQCQEKPYASYDLPSGILRDYSPEELKNPDNFYVIQSECRVVYSNLAIYDQITQKCLLRE